MYSVREGGQSFEVGFTSGGVKRMLTVMDATADRRSEAKGAIVVGSEVTFGMGRMFELQSDGQADPSFRIFRDMR